MNTWDLFSEGNEKPTPHEKFKRGIKSAGYDMDAGAKRLEDLLAKQKAERDAREKEEQKNVSEAQDEVDYDDDYQDMVRRVGEKAKAADALKAQGKQPQTKFNPKTGRYYVDHGQSKDVEEAGYGRNRGYTPGVPSPHAPTLGGRGRREDDEYHVPDPVAPTWYIRANGKIIKDKMGTPYQYRDKEVARKAAMTMMSKPFNAGKKFTLTTNPQDDRPENEARLHTEYKRNRFSGVQQRDQAQDELSNIAMNRVKGVAEGLGQPKGAGQALQSLKNLALMKSALTFQQLRQAGRESMITDAMNEAIALEQSYMANKQQGNAMFVRALRDELDNFKKGYPINSSMSDDDGYAPELGDLLQGRLGKLNFQQGVAEAQTDYQKRRQRERDVDAGKPVKPEPRNPQNDYFARRKKEKDLAEGSLDEAVDRAAKSMMEDGYEFTEGWSQKYKSSINCSHPKGFSQKAHCAGKKKHNESIEMEMVCEDCGMCETHGDHSQQSLGEACWKGYHKEGMKTMFGKRYPNCVKNKNESLETYIRKGECPGCGGGMVSESQINEKQDACYHKVKSRYKVWPSAYASGALVQCRKKGAANWGNSNESITQEEYDQLDENLKKWFSDKWVRFGPDGKIRGDCARGDSSEGKPKCLPQSKAHALGKKGRASAGARKRREDPNPERSGPAINVRTKKKSNEGVAEGKFRSQDVEEFVPENNQLDDIKSKYLPDWEMLDHRTLQAKYVAKDHRDAMKFMQFVNELSEEMDHFAEVTQDVAEVTVKTSTFDVGGLTILDFQLAMRVDIYAEKNNVEQVRMSGNFGMHKEGVSEGLTPDEQFDMIEHMVESLAKARGVDAELIWEDLESFDDDTLLAESAAWRRKEGKSKAGGLNAKGVASYRRENPGSKLQTAVTTKPSKLKKGSKAAKRRKSFCARMGGVKGPMKKPNGKPTRKALALRKWNC